MVDEQVITNLIQDESVLIDRGAIGELYETGLKFLGIGIGGVMYTAGKKGGARGARLLRSRFGLEGDDLLQAALIAFNHSNWGKAVLLNGGETRQIQIVDSVLAASVPRQKKSICYPLAGYIAGFLEEAWQRPVKVREVECIASGAPKCLFQIE